MHARQRLQTILPGGVLCIAALPLAHSSMARTSCCGHLVGDHRLGLRAVLLGAIQHQQRLHKEPRRRLMDHLPNKVFQPLQRHAACETARRMSKTSDSAVYKRKIPPFARHVFSEHCGSNEPRLLQSTVPACLAFKAGSAPEACELNERVRWSRGLMS